MEILILEKKVLVQKLDSLKAAVKEVDKAKYKAVVDEVVAELKKEGNMTSVQVKKLASYLAKDYQVLVAKSDKNAKKNKAKS